MSGGMVHSWRSNSSQRCLMWLRLELCAVYSSSSTPTVVKSDWPRACFAQRVLSRWKRIRCYSIQRHAVQLCATKCGSSLEKKRKGEASTYFWSCSVQWPTKLWTQPHHRFRFHSLYCFINTLTLCHTVSVTLNTVLWLLYWNPGTFSSLMLFIHGGVNVTTI